MNSSSATNAPSAVSNTRQKPNPHAWFLTDLKDVPKNGFKVMETFACGGGSSMGWKRAGCDVIAANDIDPEMAYHYKLNIEPKHYYLCPIKDLLKKELPDELFNLDILSGSPPCSSFSMAGNREKDWGKKKHFREGQTEQVLDDLFFDYLNLVDRLRPKVAIAENVKGMILGSAKGYTKMIMARYKEIGYRCQLFLVNAADCGVPQKRERVFFCAIRNDINAPKLTLKPEHRWIGAGEATSDLQALSDEEVRETQASSFDLKYWKHVPEGEFFSVTIKKMENRVSGFSQEKVHRNRPSATITSKKDCKLHWRQPRRLTFREWLRLGSFPDDYQAKTPSIGKYMIGMSVPPKMTEQVARAVIDQWLS